VYVSLLGLGSYHGTDTGVKLMENVERCIFESNLLIGMKNKEKET
jgi:hypothetical protein